MGTCVVVDDRAVCKSLNVVRQVLRDRRTKSASLAAGARPLCHVIMPYGKKPSQAEPGRGPAEIDFNALWDHGYVPIIEAFGYEPVRADQDTGGLIMLERLYFADLVLADMTIPNGNVYYQVGIRHAAQKTGCVLLAADWSKQLFDVVQMRTVRYPLPEGNITDATAAAFQVAIKEGIATLRDGLSVMHQSIPGYPEDVDPAKATTTKDQLTELAAFQTKVREVRAAPSHKRMQLAQALVASEGAPPATYPIALALLLLLRDSVNEAADWNIVLGFVSGLPRKFADEPEIQEIRAFAAAQAGNDLQAIAELDTLIEMAGPTPERLGLMGGRYKRLISTAASAAEKRQALAKAIECYERGMELDLNAYYCSSNLPRLYRTRARPGDEERAQATLRLVIAACERAKRLNTADEWLHQTLLAAAFDLGDLDKVDELADDVLAEGPAAWKIDTVLYDLEASVSQVTDEAKRKRLSAVIDRIKAA
jgi:tetratricopeptide (TPR) repeat protein